MYADLSLDHRILKNVIKKNYHDILGNESPIEFMKSQK